jgi:hypothetical protein
MNLHVNSQKLWKKLSLKGVTHKSTKIAKSKITEINNLRKSIFNKVNISILLGLKKK